MELILKCLAIIHRTDPAGASSCGITTLDYESWDQAMEGCVGVVAIVAVLEEVFGCEWGLLAEEFEGDVARCCFEDYFGVGLRFEVVD